MGVPPRKRNHKHLVKIDTTMIFDEAKSVIREKTIRS
jgi:hypothetical protein